MLLDGARTSTSQKASASAKVVLGGHRLAQVAEHGGAARRVGAGHEHRMRLLGAPRHETQQRALAGLPADRSRPADTVC
jgi:hypothetical protein